MIGKRLAHYDITAKLGEGGMGEVYRAKDTKLKEADTVKSRVLWSGLLLWSLGSAAVLADGSISSRVERTALGERILAQEVTVDAPLEEVWTAYTTSDGWSAWASPVARIDLRVGGTIETHYDPDAAIGDPGTNTLRIVNYVPRRLLTLKADISERWPEVLKQDGENLANIILFESLSPNRTKIESYGVGYGNSPEYDELMQFFIEGNEALLRKLIEVLEDDPRP